MIDQLDVDGVPTLLARTTGPMHAGLMFRVGQADETLARRGTTHLLEHLVLHAVGMADYHYNGATGSVVTHFHMQGPAEDISAFLAGVCRSLKQFAVDRFETEKTILRTEWSSRSVPATEAMPLWRYGARDYGLVSFPEWGLTEVTVEDLQAWAGRFFTRENAVLWIAGDDVPTGLTLDLPPGRRHPAPAASSALPNTPAFFSGSSRATAMDTVVPRQVATTVFTGVLERELFRALRREGGLSYTAAATYEPRGDGSAVVTALADALPDKQDAVLGGFIDVLAKLRVGRIDEADVAAVVAKKTDGLATAEADAARLPQAAFNLLTGHPISTGDELIRELKAVTSADVHALAAVALESALLMTPHGRAADWAGYAAAPTGSEHIIAGVTYPGVGGSTGQLVVGETGVSLIPTDGQPATVLFDNCAAMLTWPDGARQLIGEDAISIRIEPALYRNAGQLNIDGRVPTGVCVAMPPRDPDQIPRPKTVRPPAAFTWLHGLNLRQRLLLGVLGFATLVAGGLALAVSVAMVLGALGARPLAAIGSWMIAGYLGRVFRKTWQRMRE